MLLCLLLIVLLQRRRTEEHQWLESRLALWRPRFNGDWLKRAAAAKAGIYGNNAVEAMYPMTKTLADGKVLDCSKHNCMLTFTADQFPPVNAFWSTLPIPARGDCCDRHSDGNTGGCA